MFLNLTSAEEFGALLTPFLIHRQRIMLMQVSKRLAATYLVQPNGMFCFYFLLIAEKRMCITKFICEWLYNFPS